VPVGQGAPRLKYYVFLWVLLDYTPFTGEKAVFWIPVTRFGSNLIYYQGALVVELRELHVTGYKRHSLPLYIQSVVF
jgi:hypothetical protein